MTRSPLLFCAFARPDEAWMAALEQQCSPMVRDGLTRIWSERQIVGGEIREAAIERHLEEATIILFLVSADLLADCAALIDRALVRSQAGQATIVPVLVRTVDWQRSPFGPLQPLPRNYQAVRNWADTDDAWLDVVRGIREIVNGARPRPEPQGAATATPGPDRMVLLKQLRALLPSQFETLIFRLRIPMADVLPPTAPQGTRAIELIRLAEQPDGIGLDGLLAHVQRVISPGHEGVHETLTADLASHPRPVLSPLTAKRRLQL